MQCPMIGKIRERDGPRSVTGGLVHDGDWSLFDVSPGRWHQPGAQGRGWHVGADEFILCRIYVALVELGAPWDSS